MSSKNKVDAYIQISRLVDKGEDELANHLLATYLSQTIKDATQKSHYTPHITIPLRAKTSQEKADKVIKRLSLNQD